MTSVETRRYPESARDVFAWYGAAMHAAQFFEGDLITLHLTARARNNGGGTLSDVRGWEDLVSRHTLGRLLKEMEGLVQVSPHVRETWEKAVAARNRLAHSYFWSHFEQLSASEAHEDLVIGLQGDALLFSEAAAAARDLVEHLIP